MSGQKAAAIGYEAPNFALKDQFNKDFHISGYRGKKILLSFHPLAWTSVCAQQMKALDDHYQQFLELNTIPVGISVDSSACKAAWAKELGLKHLALLADFWPHGHAASIYGLLRPKDGFSERANIIINEEQKIIFVKVYDIHQLPDLDEILEIIRK